jgi:hypothetical protein
MAELSMQFELETDIITSTKLCRSTIVSLKCTVREQAQLGDGYEFLVRVPGNIRDFITIMVNIRLHPSGTSSTSVYLTASQPGFLGPARRKSLEEALGAIRNSLALEISNAAKKNNDTSDAYNKFIDFGKLRDAGIISDDEYELKRKEYLDRL